MNPSDVAESFGEFCKSCGPSSDLLANGFRRAVEELGFRYFALCSHVDPLDPPPHAIMIHNYPNEWVCHFSARKYYAIDPVMKRAERNGYPFFWDNAFESEPLSGKQRMILSEARRLGVAHGYTVPINFPWIPGALRASCSVIPDSGTVDKSHYLAVQVMALYLYSSMCAACAPWPSVTRAALTARERECLMLAGIGMNDREIARELGVGSTTVHSHIQNSMLRFAAHRRIQAIMRALMSGEIWLGDMAVRWKAADKKRGTATRWGRG